LYTLRDARRRGPHRTAWGWGALDRRLQRRSADGAVGGRRDL